ncbi:unnamed protein product [Clavelina lepadiformis]|uniref:Secreted protein n=1 Tax=Clavelina lepadiformis TaxID=159417 RepID=A0ABP0GWJ8_CLALP
MAIILFKLCVLGFVCNYITILLCYFGCGKSYIKKNNIKIFKNPSIQHSISEEYLLLFFLLHVSIRVTCDDCTNLTGENKQMLYSQGLQDAKTNIPTSKLF